MKSVLVSAFLAVCLLGCGNETPSGPPQVKYGSVECAGCGMIVTIERYAAACVSPSSAGNPVLVFDDINCMIEYEHDHPLAADTRRYVHDADTLQWLEAGKARFVLNPEIHTPMGSGLAAFANASSEHAKTYYDLLANVRSPSTVPTSGR